MERGFPALFHFSPLKKMEDDNNENLLEQLYALALPTYSIVDAPHPPVDKRLGVLLLRVRRGPGIEGKREEKDGKKKKEEGKEEEMQQQGPQGPDRPWEVIARIPYARDNTGSFPRNLMEAVHKQPVYQADPLLHTTLVNRLYARAYATLPTFLRVKLEQLSPTQIYYCCLFLRTRGYWVWEMDGDRLQAEQ